MPGTGRFAPSPSGELHVGNLRTAVIAWLAARSSGRAFLLRIEDLDEQRSRPEHIARQIADLRALGVDWNDEPVLQSQRLAGYRVALDDLTARGHTFECFCSRREIREAQSAPHGDQGRYPGTCRELSDAERAARWRAGRTPAVRLRADGAERDWEDFVLGPRRGVADDVVLARWDGALAYSLAVVVDDLAQGVDQVVRGDDLADQTATQIVLAELMGGASPAFGHVPLVLGPTGARLAKRDGAVTLGELAERGIGPREVLARMLGSLGPAVPDGVRTLEEAARGFELARLPRDPWVLVPSDW